MKKVLILISALFSLPYFADAQLQRGTIMIGGQLGNVQFGLGSTSQVSLQITPKVGYFVSNNLAIGAEVPLGFSVIKDTDPVFNYGIGAFGRYYFAPREFNIDNILNKGRFFGEAGVGVAGQTDVEVGANIRLGGGYAYFLSPNIALETSLMYQGTYGAGNVSGLVFNLGFQIHLPSSRIRSEYYDIKKEVE